MMRTPGEREQILLKRAVGPFYRWLERPLTQIELASFGHGWRAGDQGQRLADVVDDIDLSHDQAPQVLEFVAYGHHSGYASFLRQPPDYDQVQELLRGGLKALLDEEQPAEQVGTLERLARLLEGEN